MSNQAQFDVLLQLRPSVVADIFTRVLNDPVTTDPQSAATLPRRLRIAVPGTLLWWDTPNLTLSDDGTITVSMALAGGMHQLPSPSDPGRIASVSGTLKARMKPVMSELARSPCLALELDTIDQSGLRASYAGSNALPLVGAGGARDAIVQAVVRDAVSVLAAQPALIAFLRDFGKRPITPTHAAFPFEATPSRERVKLYWPRGGALLALGIPVAGGAGDFAQAGLGLPSRADSNASVTVSSGFLTAKLQGLLAAGGLARSLRDNSGNELAELTGLESRVHPGELAFLFRVAHGYVRGTLEARLGLALDATNGRLVVTVRQTSMDLDTVPAGGGDTTASLASLSALPSRLDPGFWSGIVTALLGARQDQGGLDLTQLYLVPGTQVAVSGRATALELADDVLTIYTSLPTDAIFVPEPPHRQPKVIVAQDPLHVPTQSAPGQPVEATVAAVVPSESYPPYDYSWDAKNVDHVSGEHGQTFTVRGVPPNTGVVAEILTQASVTVIDSFGQTDDASSPVLARPARRQRQSQPRSQSRPRSPLKVIIPALLIAAVIIGSGLAIAGKLTPPPSSGLPPGIGVTPGTDYQQTCTLAAPSLPPIFVTLDNSQNTAAITWTASALGAVPGGTEPWATLNGSGQSASGTITGKGNTILTIQPASDLCGAIQAAATTQRFTVSISYSLAGSGLHGLDGAAASDAVALAAGSRQITLSDTIGFSAFSAYVLNADGLPTVTFAQSCDPNLTTAPREHVVILDNTRSTSAAQWQLSIPDQVPITGSPIEPWASAEPLGGTVEAGQQSRVVVALARDLCQQLLGATAPVPLRLVVLANDRNPITLTDTVTPTPPTVNFSITPLTSQQQCPNGVQPITLTLDNTQSNVPVTWQVGSIDSVAPPGTPTPSSGEVWASVSPSNGTLNPGTGGTSTVTITPASDICGQFLFTGQTNDYHVVFTYGSGQSITVTDTVTYPIP